MPKLVSIDPGKSGAIASFDYDHTILTPVTVYDTPMIGREYNLQRVLDILRGENPDVVVIEDCSLLKGQEGRTSAMSIGFGMGMWSMAVAALQIRFEKIRPAEWTKTLKFRTGATKEDHAVLAVKLFPGFSQSFYGPRGGLLDGRVDAVLIGEAWHRQNYRNGAKAA